MVYVYYIYKFHYLRHGSFFWLRITTFMNFSLFNVLDKIFYHLSLHPWGSFAFFMVKGKIKARVVVINLYLVEMFWEREGEDVPYYLFLVIELLGLCTNIWEWIHISSHVFCVHVSIYDVSSPRPTWTVEAPTRKGISEVLFQISSYFFELCNFSLRKRR